MFSEGDVAMLMESSSRPLSAVFHNIHPASLWRSRKGHLSFNQVIIHRSVFNSAHDEYSEVKYAVLRPLLDTHFVYKSVNAWGWVKWKP